MTKEGLFNDIPLPERINYNSEPILVSNVYFSKRSFVKSFLPARQIIVMYYGLKL